MKFAHPQWFWALIALAVLSAAFAIELKSRVKKLESFVAPQLWSALLPGFKPHSRRRKLRLWTLAVLFGILALCRPQWGMKEEKVQVSSLDIVVTLDVSNSMETEDVVPTRLKKAQHVVRSIAERLNGDRMGLIAFAGGAFPASPLTTDLGYVMEVLQNLSPRSIPNQGTDIGTALEVAGRALERGAEQKDEMSGSQVVILISDGEDLEQRALDGAKALQKSGIRLFVLGVGTERGGPIPIRDENGNLRGYKKDSQGQGVVSRFNPQALMKLAESVAGKYWNVTPSESEIEDLIAQLGTLERKDHNETRRIIREERYQVPLLLAVLLLIIELCIGFTYRVAAVRLAVILMVLAPGSVLTFCTQLFSAEAQAKDTVGSYYQNQKGLEAFSKGDLDQAKEYFNRAQQSDESRTELKFNQGVVELQKKNIEGALENFSGSAEAALSKNNPSLAARSFYNLGATLEGKGDTDSALGAYLNALEAAQKAKDPEFESDVRKKIELMTRQDEKKQKQKPEGDEGKNGQDPQGKSGDKSDKDSSSKKDKQDQGQAPKHFKDPPSGGKMFKSQKLSKEDAERVMNELSERDRQLQQKLKKQKGPANLDKDRDW